MAEPGFLMIGSGEYTCGFVPLNAAGTAARDKPAGVVAITVLDLKSRGVFKGPVLLAGAVGTEMPAVRATLQRNIHSVYTNLKDVQIDKTYPADDVSFDPAAYREALKDLPKGSAVTIFTPDPTHKLIALDCMRAGMHVLIAKPAVKTLEDHLELVEAAKAAGVLCGVEYHKRWDPIYHDAVLRHRSCASSVFTHFSATMTQAKRQLDTFRNWAGKDSDISFYLNSHHIDIHCWAVGLAMRPISVMAMASRGTAEEYLGVHRVIEDTITLMVQWEEFGAEQKRKGVAVYTAGWTAPQTEDAHTQQAFHLLGPTHEVHADQAHRGYTRSTDESYNSLNPLYMRYVPDDDTGAFAGQTGYGYRSIEGFLSMALRGVKDPKFESQVASIQSTAMVTAILDAGRRSLDSNVPVTITYEGESSTPTGFK